MNSPYLPAGLPSPGTGPDGLSEPYWQGTREGKLRIQQCSGCSAWQWGPEWICHRCHSFDLKWIDIEGKEMPSTAGVIKPNEDFTGSTSIGHIFRVRDDKKAEICLIEVEATSEKVNIQK